jgi:hypothetical protein
VVSFDDEHHSGRRVSWLRGTPSPVWGLFLLAPGFEAGELLSLRSKVAEGPSLLDPTLLLAVVRRELAKLNVQLRSR